VLAVLGVADAQLLQDTIDAVAEGDSRRALQAVEACVQQGHDPASFASDLELRARDLLKRDHLLRADVRGRFDAMFLHHIEEAEDVAHAGQRHALLSREVLDDLHLADVALRVPAPIRRRAMRLD